MNDDSRQKGRARLAFVAVLLLACTVTAVLGGQAIRHLPIAFDGGFNAQAARALVETGRYATTYRGLSDFDLRVQTGPAVIVPTAVAFRRLGVNSTTAQLPNLVYLVLLFGLATTYANLHGGPLAAGLAALLLLGLPRLFPLGLGLLGEVPAVVFFLAGLLCLDLVTGRRWTVAALAAGACFALAVSTKIMIAMAVAVILPIAIADRLSSRSVSCPSWIAMSAGFVLAPLPFEILRLRSLTLPGYLEWWWVLLQRAFSQGTSMGFAEPAVGVGKSVRHLTVLSRDLGSPPWLVAILLAAPLLLLGAALIHDRRQPHTDRRVSLSLVVLAAAGAVLTGWWLTLSPTGHTWLRRALPGLILIALLSSIVVVRAARRALGAARRTPGTAGRRAIRATVLVAGTLLVSWLWLAGNGLDALGALTLMRPEREWTDVMVTAINRLPPDATIYAQGWYEAPTLSALTGRSFRDLDQFPLGMYRTPLHETYYVVDYHMFRNVPEAVRTLLARATTELVQEVGQCFLYRLTRLEPYPPIPAPASVAELPTMFRPGQGDDPFVGGLGTTAATRTYSHAVSGFLLRREDAACLALSLWVGGTAPHTKVLQVRVDDRPVLTTPVAERAQLQELLRLPDAASPTPRASLVELWMYRWGPPQPYQLWFSDLGVFAVGEVGFVPCPDDRLVPSPGGRTSGDAAARPRP